jgi:hypothetical protein
VEVVPLLGLRWSWGGWRYVQLVALPDVHLQVHQKLFDGFY